MHVGAEVGLGLGIVVLGLLVQHLLLAAGPGQPPFSRGPLPFLGHALGFARDPKAFAERMRKKHGWIFTVYIAGQKMTILSDPVVGCRQALSNSALSVELFIKYLSQTLFGYSPALSVNLALLDRLRLTVGRVMAARKMSEDIYESLKTTYVATVTTYADGERDLYEYCRHSMYHASATALFGAAFPVNAIYKPYMDFEDAVMKFTRSYPRIFNLKGYRGRQKVLKELAAFFADRELVVKASGMVQELYGVFEDSELGSPDDLAGYFFSIVFASKSNSIPAAFWMLAHIVSDAELKQQVTGVVLSYYVPDKRDFNWDGLLADPLLSSCFKETVRLTANLILARVVTRDTSIKVGSPAAPEREYKLAQGTNVLTFLNLMHWDPEAFPDAMTWHGTRFMPGSPLAAHPNWHAYMPWGGGAHLCPGRRLALFEGVAQVVYSLVLFDIHPTGPVPDMYIGEKYGGGVAKPKGPYKVRMTRRKTPLVDVRVN